MPYCVAIVEDAGPEREVGSPTCQAVSPPAMISTKHCAMRKRLWPLCGFTGPTRVLRRERFPH
jgi:hypothetical protein